MLLSILWGILIIPSLVFFVASLFAFDGVGASQKPLVWIAFLASFTLPLVLLICCVGGIIASRGVRTKRKNLAATVFGIFPVIALLGAALIFII
jgi:hypothetical protein